MRYTATKVPFPLEVMLPVVIINITRFRQVHAIQAETIKVAGELTTNFLNSRHAEFGSTCHTGIVWDFAVKFEKSRTGKNFLDRLLVVLVKWPNAGPAETLVVCE
jgi:hypothetical protein